MHANAIITDQVYSALKTDQVQNTILNLGASNQMDKSEVLRLIEALKAHQVSCAFSVSIKISLFYNASFVCKPKNNKNHCQKIVFLLVG